MSNEVSNQVPEGYKQTEAGVIPEDWDVSTIGDFTVWKSGGTPSRKRTDFWEGEIPWISGSTLKTFEITTSDQFLTAEGVAAGSNMAPVDATLLLVRGSALHNHIRAGLVVSPVSFNQDVKSLMPFESVYPKYLTFFIQGMESELLKLVSSAGNSAGVLDTELVKNFKFLKPSLEEQTSIANALSDVDGLIGSLEKLIAKKRAIKTAAMQLLLTGKKRLPPFDQTHTGYKQTDLGEIPNDWEVRNISEALTIRHGKDQKQVERENGDFPVLGTGGEIGRTNSFLYNKPSVLIGRKGSINKPIYMDTPFWTVDTLFYSEVDAKYSAKFIYYKFCQIDWMSYNEASGVPSLNASTIENVPLAFPINIEEQLTISNVISEMDKEIEALEQRLNKTQQLKQGMMQELLTGRTRLV